MDLFFWWEEIAPVVTCSWTGGILLKIFFARWICLQTRDLPTSQMKWRGDFCCVLLDNHRNPNISTSWEVQIKPNLVDSPELECMMHASLICFHGPEPMVSVLLGFYDSINFSFAALQYKCFYRFLVSHVSLPSYLNIVCTKMYVLHFLQQKHT